jgi:hypothetical protein
VLRVSSEAVFGEAKPPSRRDIAARAFLEGTSYTQPKETNDQVQSLSHQPDARRDQVPYGSDLDGQDGEEIQSQCQNPAPDNWHAAGTV